MPDLEFPVYIRPPISEVGFSIASATPMFNPAEVARIHDRVRTNYPHLERQPPVIALELSPVLNIPPLVLDTDHGVPPRWWFQSESGRQLVQLQERFLGWNWRRQSGLQHSPDYPGFEKVYAEARKAFGAVSGAMEGSLPTLSGAQLMYDNVIPLLDQAGAALRLSDVIATWNPVDPPAPMFGWQSAWMEEITTDLLMPGNPLTHSNGVLQTQITQAGIIGGDGEILPVVRIQFNAVRQVTSLEDAYSFFPRAHDYIRKTILRLTTPKCREAWNQSW